MVDPAKDNNTHSIFESSEVPWIYRAENKPDHLDYVELVRRAGVDLAATYREATGQELTGAQNLVVKGKPLRFKRGQIIPIHTHVNDLTNSGTVVMLKRITTPGGAIFYTDGSDEKDNGYQVLAENQWAVVDARRKYYGEVLDTAGVPDHVEMDLFAISFVDDNGKAVDLEPALVVPTNR
jgi:hypothetical protein